MSSNATLDVVKTYATSLVLAEITVALTGTQNWRAYALAAAAAILPPVIRAIDPADPAFGRVADQAAAKLGTQVKAAEGPNAIAGAPAIETPQTPTTPQA